MSTSTTEEPEVPFDERLARYIEGMWPHIKALEGGRLLIEAQGQIDSYLAKARENAELAGDLLFENWKLKEAFHDAVTRPKGVVPESGEEFYDPDLCASAALREAGS